MGHLKYSKPIQLQRGMPKPEQTLIRPQNHHPSMHWHWFTWLRPGHSALISGAARCEFQRLGSWEDPEADSDHSNPPPLVQEPTLQPQRNKGRRQKENSWANRQSDAPLTSFDIIVFCCGLAMFGAHRPPSSDQDSPLPPLRHGESGGSGQQLDNPLSP